jgi:hypothetical protein
MLQQPYPTPPRPGNYHYGRPVIAPQVKLVAPPTQQTIRNVAEWHRWHWRPSFAR